MCVPSSEFTSDDLEALAATHDCPKEPTFRHACFMVECGIVMTVVADQMYRFEQTSLGFRTEEFRISHLLVLNTDNTIQVLPECLFAIRNSQQVNRRLM